MDAIMKSIDEEKENSQLEGLIVSVKGIKDNLERWKIQREIFIKINRDNGKIPIIHSDWMKDIKYRYRAMNKQQFHYQYLRIIEDGYEKNLKQFNRLKKGLEIYTDKNKWIEKVVNLNFFSYI
jgi:hypothetical protein